MFKRILGSILAGLLVLSGLLATAAPAQAYPSCSPSATAGMLHLYDLQGYCGSSYQWYVTPGQCIYLGSPAPGNWAGSVWNRSTRGIILSSNTNCTGDSVAIRPGTSHPNLYSIGGYNLGNRVSSFYVA